MTITTHEHEGVVVTIETERDFVKVTVKGRTVYNNFGLPPEPDAVVIYASGKDALRQSRDKSKSSKLKQQIRPYDPDRDYEDRLTDFIREYKRQKGAGNEPE